MGCWAGGGRGFTLIEVVLVISMAAVLVLALGGLLAAGLRIWDTAETLQLDRREGEGALLRVTQILRRARKVIEVEDYSLRLLDKEGLPVSIVLEESGQLYRHKEGGVTLLGEGLTNRVQDTALFTAGAGLIWVKVAVGAGEVDFSLNSGELIRTAGGRRDEGDLGSE